MKDDVDPPRELEYFWHSKSWGLPYEGGWMEQPAGLITKMTTLGNIYNVMKLYQDCNESLGEVKEKHGIEVRKAIIEILRELHGYNE